MPPLIVDPFNFNMLLPVTSFNHVYACVESGMLKQKQRPPAQTDAHMNHAAASKTKPVQRTKGICEILNQIISFCVQIWRSQG